MESWIVGMLMLMQARWNAVWYFCLQVWMKVANHKLDIQNNTLTQIRVVISAIQNLAKDWCLPSHRHQQTRRIQVQHQTSLLLQIQISTLKPFIRVRFHSSKMREIVSLSMPSTIAAVLRRAYLYPWMSYPSKSGLDQETIKLTDCSQHLQVHLQTGQCVCAIYQSCHPSRRADW